jgi:DNA-binding MarR family transcriptional regulator
MAEREHIVPETMKKAGKPMRPGDLAKMTGIESKEVSKIIDDLKKKGKISSSKRCFCAPVEG